MKILSYNIMSGGFDKYEYQNPQPQRIAQIKEVIALNQPDIVSLVDTFRWDEIYTPQQLCEMFGYEHAFCINLGDKRLIEIGHNNGITVLSNVKGTQFFELNLGTRKSVKSVIPTQEGTLNLYCLYLDDLSEDVRLQQVETLKKHLDENASLITGDLNTISPTDINFTKEKLDEFLAQNPKFEGFKDQLYDMLRGEVINSLQCLGFRDNSNQLAPTFPTKLPNISSVPLVRVDFCLSKNTTGVKCEVLKGELYDKTSDHYPLLIEL